MSMKKVLTLVGVLVLATLVLTACAGSAGPEGPAGPAGPAGAEGPAGAPCLLYTSPSPRDRQKSRMPSSA